MTAEQTPKVTSIADAIGLVDLNRAEQFNPTRWPYTYACDFLRSHPEIVPQEVWQAKPAPWRENDTDLISRADASRVRQVWAAMTGTEDEDAAELLAAAYCREYGISVPAAFLDEED